MKKPTTIYRSLLRDAWNVTWQRKSLWVFGIFAGILFRGSVIDVAISGVRRISDTGSLLEHMLDRSFIGYGYVSQFLLRLQKIDSGQFAWLLVALTVVAVGLICAGVISQAALMHAAGSKPKHPRDIRRHVLTHFWDVLMLNLITKVLSVLLVALASLPVFLFFVSNATITWIAFVHLLIYIPAVIILNILFLLTLADIVEANTRILEAIENALRIFKTHWLAALELGLLLFFVTLGAGLLFAGLLSILSLPYGYLYHSAVLSGSIGLFSLTNIFLGIIVFALTLAFGGAMVTFHYSAWHLFYARASHRLHGRNPFAKIWRLLFA